MQLYLLLKWVHVGSVITSFSLFVLRGIWRWYEPNRIFPTLIRVLPHVVDTLLLLSALTLLVLGGWNPLVDNWLAAKLLALVLYIILGHIALNCRYDRQTSAVFGLLALIVFGYIVAVAITQMPLPWLA